MIGTTPQPHISGGDGRNRTGDLLLAKQVLSRLSYVPTLSTGRCPPPRALLSWWAHLDLNQGPRPYQGRALTN